MEKKTVRVWDLGVRVFHWTLVVSFAIAYFLYREDYHPWLGYLIFGLVAWRVVWGFVGSPYARFTAFLYSPRETVQYTFSALRLGDAKEYLSHNPMGALMVFLLLMSLTGQTVSGAMLYAAQDLSGPLAGLIPTEWEDWLEPLHEILADVLAVMVVCHLAGVAWATWWHRENYVRAMVTGNKSAYKRRHHREPH